MSLQRVLDQLTQVGLFPEAETGEQPLEPRRFILALARLLGRQIRFGGRGIGHGDASAVRALLASA